MKDKNPKKSRKRSDSDKGNPDLAVLSDRLRGIISDRMDGESQKEIGDKLGVTPMRISQLEKEACKQLEAAGVDCYHRCGPNGGRPPKPIEKRPVNFTLSLAPELAKAAAELAGSDDGRDVHAIRDGIRSMLATFKKD